jgi:hypothetical protein
VERRVHRRRRRGARELREPDPDRSPAAPTSRA